ncbi:hypothetical protein GCM10009676_29760 [Prauserella halophila]|uniref:Uncharacterized protein n=1 Tax=Prauserella halophila TaxID=185641 RepID=A0ABP4GXF5_9PSEU
MADGGEGTRDDVDCTDSDGWFDLVDRKNDRIRRPCCGFRGPCCGENGKRVPARRCYVTPVTEQVTELRAAMRTALKDAMKTKDKGATSALRSALGAIDNAEAVQAETAPDAGSDNVAGAVAGVGTADVARRELTGEDVTGIVRSAVDERRANAADYDRLGQHDAAEAVRYEASVLARFVDG